MNWSVQKKALHFIAGIRLNFDVGLDDLNRVILIRRGERRDRESVLHLHLSVLNSGEPAALGTMAAILIFGIRSKHRSRHPLKFGSLM